VGRVNEGRCPVHGCSYVGKLDGHHVYPRRWAKNWTEDQKEYVRYICRPDHERLHDILTEYETYHGKGHPRALNPEMYAYIFNKFVSGELRWPDSRGGDRRSRDARPVMARR